MLFRSAGTPWNLDHAESQRLSDHAEKYRATTPWETQVEAFLDRETASYQSRAIGAEPHFDIGQVTAYLNLPSEKAADARTMQKVASILTEAGCRKGRPRVGDKRPSRWFIPGVDPKGW